MGMQGFMLEGSCYIPPCKPKFPSNLQNHDHNREIFENEKYVHIIITVVSQGSAHVSHFKGPL